jgi:hypothetical protein
MQVHIAAIHTGLARFILAGLLSTVHIDDNAAITSVTTQRTGSRIVLLGLATNKSLNLLYNQRVQKHHG